MGYVGYSRHILGPPALCFNPFIHLTWIGSAEWTRWHNANCFFFLGQNNAHCWMLLITRLWGPKREVQLCKCKWVLLLCLFWNATHPFPPCFLPPTPLEPSSPLHAPPSSGGGRSFFLSAPSHPPPLSRWRRRRLATTAMVSVRIIVHRRRCGFTTRWVKRRSFWNPRWNGKWECTCAESLLMISVILGTLASMSILTFFTGSSSLVFTGEIPIKKVIFFAPLFAQITI